MLRWVASMLLRTAILISGILQANSSAFAMDATAALLEFSPLKGAIGQLDLRGELAIAPQFSLGVALHNWSEEGQVPSRPDVEQAVAVTGRWYPPVAKSHGPFLGGIVMHYEGSTGQMQRRDFVSYAMPSGAGLNDEWVVHHQGLRLGVESGYRVHFGALFTAALNMQVTRVISRQSDTEILVLGRREDVSNLQPLSDISRRLLLTVGIALR